MRHGAETRWCFNSGKVAPALSVYVGGNPPYGMTATCNLCNQIVAIQRFRLNSIIPNDYRYEYVAHLDGRLHRV